MGWMTTTLWVLTGLLVLVVLLTLTAARAGRANRHPASPRKPFWILTMRFGGLVALVRIVILWYLTYREWTGTQSLSLLPLILLLYPEGLLLPPTWRLTTTHVWLFSGLLIIGSLIMTGVVALFMAAVSLLTSRNSV